MTIITHYSQCSHLPVCFMMLGKHLASWVALEVFFEYASRPLQRSLVELIRTKTSTLQNQETKQTKPNKPNNKPKPTKPNKANQQSNACLFSSQHLWTQHILGSWRKIKSRRVGKTITRNTTPLDYADSYGDKSWSHQTLVITNLAVVSLKNAFDVSLFQSLSGINLPFPYIICTEVGQNPVPPMVPQSAFHTDYLQSLAHSLKLPKLVIAF